MLSPFLYAFVLSVTITLRNITTPFRNVTTPLRNITTPLRNVTTPLSNVTTPLRNVTTPLRNVTTPLRNVTTPLRNVTIPLRNVTTPYCQTKTTTWRLACLASRRGTAPFVAQHNRQQSLRPCLSHPQCSNNYSAASLEKVRWPGKACGAMAFALTFLLLFLSKKKSKERKKRKMPGQARHDESPKVTNLRKTVVTEKRVANLFLRRVQEVGNPD